jgi:hypothetical protein
MNLRYNEYNNILLNYQLSNDMASYKFSIYPEPISIHYKIINNEKVKFGIFRVIAHPEYDNRELQIELLYEARYFLKYHFLRFLEIYGFSHEMNNIRNINSYDYMYNTIYEIKNITKEGAIDKCNKLLLYESINK